MEMHSMATVAALNSLPLFSSAPELPIRQQVNAERLLNAPWCLHSTGHPLILLFLLHLCCVKVLSTLP